MSEAALAIAPDSAAPAAPAPAAPATPWYQGKADPDIIGHWDNKKWDKNDPVVIALEASKQARELQKHFGVPPDQLLKLPKDPNDQAAWSSVRERLGMPKEAKDYDFSAVKFKDGTELDQSFNDKIRGALHKAGVAKDAAPDIARAFVEFMDSADQAQADVRNATVKNERAALQREWGNNFDFNRLTAMQGAKRLGVDETVISKLEGEIGYAKVMEMFRRVGQGTNEDTFVEGTSTNPSTLNGAIARKNELMADKAWAERYLQGGAKERQEMNALLELIAGARAA